ncbi:MAG TPA: autotransporter-associated beta strand repeat-containing protein [Verrucomicrobiota bacterium]|nr:autotransporter-associated beta strand repeat-containing protein [Verrucomicrobiota bacterium]HNT16134.1 autotransporter-associated beta strand repeat-containing protein [Verrucomicrobiota bacterium]
MNRTNRSLCTLTALGCLWLAVSAGRAASIVKNNNLGNLDAGTSWVGGVAPTAGDVAVFDATYATTGPLNVGTAVQWQGLQITSPGGAVLINNSVEGNHVGIDAGGIDMSGATANLVLRRYALNASQTWDIAAGRSFRIGSPDATLYPAANSVNNNRVGVFMNNAPGATITKNGAGVVLLDLGNTTLGEVNWRINAGVLANVWHRENAFGAGTITLAGGGLATGTPIAGSVGNWVWNNSIILETATTSFIDHQNVSGSGRWLKLENLISGNGNLELRNTGVGFDNLNNGFILAGPNTMSGTLTIPPNSIVRVGGSAPGENNAAAGGFGTLGAAAVVNHGWLTFSHTGLFEVTNDISGGGAVRIGSESLVGTDTQSVSVHGQWTYSGNTLINRGALTLAAGSALPNTAEIYLNAPEGEAATLDVTALGSYSLGSGRKLLGRGNTGVNQVYGNFTAASGSQLVPGGSNAVNTLIFANDLALSGGGTIQVDLRNGVADALQVYGNLSAAGVTTIQFVAPDPLNTGEYPLVQVSGGFAGNVGNFAFTGLTAQGTRQTFSLAYNTVANPNTLVLVVGGAPPGNLTWVGDGSANVWDQAGAANWTDGVGPEMFFIGDSVTFDDSGSTAPAVNLVGTLQPASVTVNASGDYTFAGTGGIRGNATLTQNGPGTLTLANTNDYTGSTVVNGGNLAITGNSTLATLNHGAGSTVTVNGTLNYTNGSLLGVLAGTGTLTRYGQTDTVFGQFTQPEALAFAGTLRLRGSTASTAPGTLQPATGRFWLHDPNGSQPAGSRFNLDTGSSPTNAQDVIIGDWDGASGNRLLTLGSLTGYGALRSDAGSDGVRHIVVNQTLNTTFNGMVLAHGSTHNPPILRSVLLEKQGVGTLTMANVLGRQTQAAGGTSATFTILVAGGKLVLQATNTIDGPITIAGGATLEVNGAGLLGGGGTYAYAITNDGAFTWGSVGDQLLAEQISGTGGFTKTAAGVLTLGGADSYTGNTLVDAGTLVINTERTGNGNFIVAAGATLAVTNRVNGASARMNTLTLGGSGGATLEIRHLASTTVPVLNAAGGLVATGDNTIRIADAEALVATGVYPLVAYGSFTGNLPALAPLPAGVSATLVNDPLNKWIALNVTGVPVVVDPTPTNITMAISGASLVLSWPASHTGWTLQAQTNSLSVGLEPEPAAWFDVPGSSAVNQVTIPVDAANPAVFYRLRLQP